MTKAISLLLLLTSLTAFFNWAAGEPNKIYVNQSGDLVVEIAPPLWFISLPNSLSTQPIRGQFRVGDEVWVDQQVRGRIDSLSFQGAELKEMVIIPTNNSDYEPLLLPLPPKKRALKQIRKLVLNPFLSSDFQQILQLKHRRAQL